MSTLDLVLKAYIKNSKDIIHSRQKEEAVRGTEKDNKVCLN
jgi:hypothetical protein